MSRNENKMMRRRLANAYLSSIVSISLVLLLIGVSTMLLVSTKGVSDYFRENVLISVVMKLEVSDNEALSVKKDIDSLTFVRSTDFISREQGEKELAADLGQDFLKVFKTSPVPVSVNVTLKPQYVSEDSLRTVKARIEAMPEVEEVVYQKSLVDALNTNLTKISAVLGVFILLMLFISFVLINNTMRLTVFAKRFSVHTMKLVGATRSFIRGPFLAGAAVLGLFAAVAALVLLLGIMFFVRSEFAQLFEIFTMGRLLFVMGVVVMSGLLICVISTWFVVNKLVSLDKDELYY